MMNNFEISIVVPVYNSEKKIRKCIDSILSQSFTDYELILLNDGSTDYTLSILEEYEKEYSSIKVIDKLNEGIAKTRNLGISIATGKYIVFLDNDDFIDSDYLQILYDEIENTGNDIVVAGYRRVSDTKELFKVSPSKTSWAKYTVISPWAKIYRRKF
ncbi:TPA: glycosyltransferase family 2 protein, partial [Streptococcus suis]